MSKATEYMKKQQEALAARPKKLAGSGMAGLVLDIDERGDLSVTLPAPGGQNLASLVLKAGVAAAVGLWLTDTFSDGKKRKRTYTKRTKHEAPKTATDVDQGPTDGVGVTQPAVLQQSEDLSQSL